MKHHPAFLSSVWLVDLAPIALFIMPSPTHAASDGGAVAEAPPTEATWGGIAELVGTTWYGDDGAISFAWSNTDHVLLITKKGSWGETRTYLGRGADGLLHYRHRDIYSGENVEGYFKPGKTIVLRQDAAETMRCDVRKGSLVCDVRMNTDGAKIRRSVAYGASDAATAAAAIAKVPDIFPPLPKAAFDPRLGTLGLMAGEDWGSYFVLTGRDEKGPTLQLSFGDNYMFRATKPGGPLAADIGNATEKNPRGRKLATLTVDGAGRSNVCYDEQPTRRCFTFEFNVDRTKVQIHDIAAASKFIVQPPVAVNYIAERDGLFATVSKDLYVTPSNQMMRMTYFGPKTFSIEYRDWRQAGNTFCSTSEGNGLLKCNAYYGNMGRSNSYSMEFDISSADHFLIGTSTYRLQHDGTLLAVTKSSTTSTFKPISRAAAAFIIQQVADEDAVQLATRNRADSRARNEEFWSKVAGATAALANQYSSGSAMATNPAFQTTDWSARLGGVTSGNQLPGMGSVVHVAVPRATPEQLRRQDELDRYEIRKRLYSEAEGGYSPAQRAQADRDKAASEQSMEAIVTESKKRDQAYRAERSASDAAFEKERAKAQSQDDARAASAKAARLASDAKDQRDRAASQAAANARVADAREKAKASNRSGSTPAIIVTDGGHAEWQRQNDTRNADAQAQQDAADRKNAQQEAAAKAADEQARNWKPPVRQHCGLRGEPDCKAVPQ